LNGVTKDDTEQEAICRDKMTSKRTGSGFRN
jgi:hypothetical protein